MNSQVRYVAFAEDPDLPAVLKTAFVLGTRQQARRLIDITVPSISLCSVEGTASPTDRSRAWLSFAGMEYRGRSYIYKIDCYHACYRSEACSKDM